MASLLSVLDHLVYATPDVDATIEELGKLLGVRAAIGGQHPGWGTRNALLSLGPRAYLEIMGPDPAQPEPKQPRPFGIDGLTGARLVTWVAHTDDIPSVITAARRCDVDLGEPQERSRKRPDGTILTWTMTDLTKDRKSGVIPYFIDWGDSPHPAAGAPGGCTLAKLEAFHPDSAKVSEILKELGIDLRVESGQVGMRATLACPSGRVVVE